MFPLGVPIELFCDVVRIYAAAYRDNPKKISVRKIKCEAVMES
jgi:hypothetical protein